MAKIFSKIKTSLAKSTTQLLKNLCFISLVVMLVLVVATSDKWWWISLILSVSLVTSFLLKSLVIKKYTVKILFYCIDFVALVFLTGTIGKTYLSTLYSLILVDFYLNNTIKSNTIMALCSYVSYCACLFLNMYFINETLFSNVSEVISIAVTDLIVFVLIYFFVIMLMAILKRNKKIEESLLIIAEREVRLQEAYKSLEETSKLEERNRIAKQIHDTTGHSITTIIMQTEAAKLVIDTNPEDAKSKIISANLQAVEALKELRKSVRVLSGEETTFDLVENLNNAISQTMSGTNITIRAKFPETIDLDEEIARFIYSTLKEGLNNGIRHGKSTAFLFELKFTDSELYFLLSDNGVGCESFKAGYGLSTMNKKIRELGGALTINTSKDEGFEIEFTLPLRRKDD